MLKSDTESDKTTDYNDVANIEDFKDEVHMLPFFFVGTKSAF